MESEGNNAISGRGRGSGSGGAGGSEHTESSPDRPDGRAAVLDTTIADSGTDRPAVGWPVPIQDHGMDRPQERDNLIYWWHDGAGWRVTNSIGYDHIFWTYKEALCGMKQNLSDAP